LLEDIEGLSAYQRPAVDDESRRALDSEGTALIDLFLDVIRVLPRVETLVELLRVQVQLGCKVFQILIVECALVLSGLAVEEQVVVLPESILIRSTLAGLGG
jgi:hypothetical protein